MIEQILYMNLDRRTDRNEWFLESMEKAGVPMELVERIPAKDWKDYDSVEDTVKEMQKDGFALELKYFWKADMRGHVAHVWTNSIVFRRIIEDDKITLVLHDDCSVKSWDELNIMLDTLSDFKDKVRRLLHVIQLHSSLDGQIRPFDHPVYNEYFGFGARQFGDIANIYSETGADRVLRLTQGLRGPLGSVEMILHEHFNNFSSLHVLGDEWRLIEYNRHLGSDIHDKYHPEMLE